MEIKIGQKWKYTNGTEIIIKKIENNFIYYKFKEINSINWVSREGDCYTLMMFENLVNVENFKLIEDVKEEIVIPVSRLSKIE